MSHCSVESVIDVRIKIMYTLLGTEELVLFFRSELEILIMEFTKYSELGGTHKNQQVQLLSE